MVKRMLLALLTLVFVMAAGGLGGRSDCWEATEYSHHLGRRHRLLEHQCLQPGHDGLQDPEH